MHPESKSTLITAQRVPTVLAVVHGGFVLTGMVTTLLGPILPTLSATWSLVDSQAGRLFTTQFVASMIGVAVTGWLLPTRGFRSCLASGYLLMAIGVGALGVAWRPIGLAAIFCYGLGQGLTIPASNLLVSDYNPQRRSAALNLLNFAWGLGAVVCPFFISAAQHRGNFWQGLWVLALALLAVTFAAPIIPALPPRESDGTIVATGPALYRNPCAYFLGLVFFLYVGTETSLGGWVASYAKRVPSAGGVWIFAPAFFWGALLIGRLFAWRVLQRIAENKLILLALLIAATGSLTLLLANTVEIIFLGAGLAGLGLATVFPITVAQLSRFGSMATRAAGPMFALAGLGGALVPWLLGTASTSSGSLKAGLAIPLVTTLLMLALYLQDARRSQSPR